ncbi:MAG: acetate kinase [Methanotrichaceae archaeon]|nr:acetate kinase [Methanotrichaceae archaeon]
MRILVLNCGSSSVKYSLFEMDGEDGLAKGILERIDRGARLVHEACGEQIVSEIPSVRDHRGAVEVVIRAILHPKWGALESCDRIEAVGHRVVHGGERFSGSVAIDRDVIDSLEGFSNLSPLHNPANLAGIAAVSAILPGVPQVAVFDTAFHHTLPSRAYTYALPHGLCRKYGIRRYGFHGTSHRYVMEEAARLVGRPPAELRLISCHLGNGASIAAIDRGRSIDTSMGFTPMEGLIMGTRCGDLDPAIPLFLMERGMAFEEVGRLLNHESGLLGISGFSSDMREILEAVYSDASKKVLNLDHPHHDRALLALEIFIYRVKKYIGAYAAAMGGVDFVAFTGGIGERSLLICQEASSGLEFMGIELGEAREIGGGAVDLSKEGSRARVMIIPTKEELFIARETYRLLSDGRILGNDSS